MILPLVHWLDHLFEYLLLEVSVVFWWHRFYMKFCVAPSEAQIEPFIYPYFYQVAYKLRNDSGHTMHHIIPTYLFLMQVNDFFEVQNEIWLYLYTTSSWTGCKEVRLRLLHRVGPSLCIRRNTLWYYRINLSYSILQRITLIIVSILFIFISHAKTVIFGELSFIHFFHIFVRTPNL